MAENSELNFAALLKDGDRMHEITNAIDARLGDSPELRQFFGLCLQWSMQYQTCVEQNPDIGDPSDDIEPEEPAEVMETQVPSRVSSYERKKRAPSPDTDEISPKISNDESSAPRKIPRLAKETPMLSRNNSEGKVVDSDVTANQDIQFRKYGVKPEKIPPIFLSAEANLGLNFPKLNSAIVDVLGHELYDTKTLADGKIKVQLKTVDDYRKIQDMFAKQSVKYHTYRLQSEAPFKYIIKGIHPSIGMDELQEELEAQGFAISKLTRMKRLNGTPMHTVIVILPKTEKNKQIFALKKIMHAIITVEPLRKSKKPVICFNCSQFNHASESCHNPPKCGKCSGPHQARNCGVQYWGTKATCPNCGGNHVASYAKCPKNPLMLKKKTGEEKLKQQGAIIAQAIARKRDSKSYAEVVSGKKPSPPQSRISQQNQQQNQASDNLIMKLFSKIDELNSKVTQLAVEVNNLKSGNHGH